MSCPRVPEGQVHPEGRFHPAHPGVLPDLEGRFRHARLGALPDRWGPVLPVVRDSRDLLGVLEGRSHQEALAHPEVPVLLEGRGRPECLFPPWGRLGQPVPDHP